MTFAQRLKDCRARNGWSQRNIAIRIGVSQSSLQAYETGRCKPKLHILLRAAMVMDVDADELLRGERQ